MTGLRPAPPKSAVRSVSEKLKKVVACSQEWKCNYCCDTLKYTYQIDHVIPLHDGGDNSVNNLQALCVECHATKTYTETIPELIAPPARCDGQVIYKWRAPRTRWQPVRNARSLAMLNQMSIRVIPMSQGSHVPIARGHTPRSKTWTSTFQNAMACNLYNVQGAMCGSRIENRSITTPRMSSVNL